MNTEFTDELRSVVDQAAPFCVSIFMPEEVGPDAESQNVARLQALLREAERRLQCAGLDDATIRATLQPARSVDRNDSFWKAHEPGIALFLSRTYFRRYHLPFRPAEMVVAGVRPYLRPMLPLLSLDGCYYVLTLSRKTVRLWEGTHFGIRQVALKTGSAGLMQSLPHDPEQRQSFTSSGGDPLASISDQSSHERDDAAFRQFYCQIARAVLPSMRREGAPLVLAGPEDLLPIYRSVSTYPLIMQRAIEGDVDALSEHELHLQSWPIVAPYFDAARTKALSDYKAFAARGLASTAIGRIVPAAAHGRVSALFVTASPAHWGRFDAGSDRVDEHGLPQPGDEDLLNRAVVETIKHRTEVYLETPDFMPESAEMAAIFRH